MDGLLAVPERSGSFPHVQGLQKLMDGKRSSSERSSSEYTFQRARAGIAALSRNLAAEMYITGNGWRKYTIGIKELRPVLDKNWFCPTLPQTCVAECV